MAVETESHGDVSEESECAHYPQLVINNLLFHLRGNWYESILCSHMNINTVDHTVERMAWECSL